MVKYATYKVCSVFDTETTNFIIDRESHAITILYIFNDLRYEKISEYDSSKDDIRLYRDIDKALEYIDDLIEFGKSKEVIPIICAYNLMFDLQTLLKPLNDKYEFNILAQSSTHVYTLDLVIEDKTVLRFWDTFFLETNGLAAMGDICGLEKAMGSWDYSLIRTNKTPLTDSEIYYAKRDVQVIPQYLKYLLRANDYIKEKDFGVRVMTKTSLVRQLAKRKIGKLKLHSKDGKTFIYLNLLFQRLCAENREKTFESYAIRKACFRGGLTFTSATFASTVQRNVCSLDVTSMHHTHINGARTPIKFRKATKKEIENYVEDILYVSFDEMLDKYYQPFCRAIHAKIRFVNIRLKKDSCFEKWGIAIIPMAKFVKIKYVDSLFNDPAVYNERNFMADEWLKDNGYKDAAINPTFALGKLYKADICELHLTEVELWLINQVYDYDSIECISGEISASHINPPEYVTLQSNMLFELKTEFKRICNEYIEGTPYDGELSSLVPDGIVEELRKGTCEASFLKSYYIGTIKGQFNSIYGTMAMDCHKPDYVATDGDLYVDSTTLPNADNFDENDTKNVLYTYGMRIVGRSRLHLCLAMKLLYDSLGDRIRVLGGDTDSLKISVDKDVTNEELLSALQPLHDASDISIRECLSFIREKFPTYASDLHNVGHFEIESDHGIDRHDYHIEYWNKCRLSYDAKIGFQITIAGLSRNPKAYNIEKVLNNFLRAGYSVENIMQHAFGYNTLVEFDIGTTLEQHKPKAADTIDACLTDYLGNSYHVSQNEAISLYPIGKWVGGTDRNVNKSSIEYLQNEYGRNIDVTPKVISIDKYIPIVYDMTSEEVIFSGVEMEIHRVKELEPLIMDMCKYMKGEL